AWRQSGRTPRTTTRTRLYSTSSSPKPRPPSAAARLTPALMAAVQMAPHVLGDGGRHELVDRPAIARDLLDQFGRDRLQRHVGHQEDGLDRVVQLLVHARHLELIFEVGDGP